MWTLAGKRKYLRANCAQIAKFAKNCAPQGCKFAQKLRTKAKFAKNCDFVRKGEICAKIAPRKIAIFFRTAWDVTGTNLFVASCPSNVNHGITHRTATLFLHHWLIEERDVSPYKTYVNSHWSLPITAQCACCMHLLVWQKQLTVSYHLILWLMYDIIIPIISSIIDLCCQHLWNHQPEMRLGRIPTASQCYVSRCGLLLPIK